MTFNLLKQYDSIYLKFKSQFRNVCVTYELAAKISQEKYFVAVLWIR